MKENTYYRAVFGRKNLAEALFLHFFSFFSSYPRLLLEVFTRRDFGERYFRLSSVITVFIIAALVPVFAMRFAAQMASPQGESEAISGTFDADSIDSMSAAPALAESVSHYSGFPHYIAWYLFLFAFLAFAAKHYSDQRKNPGVLEFARFSLSSGVYQDYMYRLPFFKTSTNQRLNECFREPAIFFLAGCVFLLIDQYLGWLLIVCSIFYSMNYIAAYRVGDDFIMDKIDEIICNEELEDSFIFEAIAEDTRGFAHRGRRPTSHDFRQKILQLMKKNEEIPEAT